MRRFWVGLVILGALVGMWVGRMGGAQAGKAKPKPVAMTMAQLCAAACKVRAGCKVPGGSDVAACTSDCNAVSSLLTPAAMSTYMKLSCDKVKAADSGFQLAVSCKNACAHRAECLPATAKDSECLVACASMGSTLEDVNGYIKAPCDSVKQFDPTFMAARSCLKGCQHAMQCKVSGDLSQCFPICLQNIKAGTYKTEDVVAFAKVDCKTAREQLKLPEKQAAAPAGGAAGDQSMSPYRYIGRTCTAGGPAAPPGGMPGPSYDCPSFSLTVCCDFVNGRYASVGSSGQCSFAATCLMPRF